MAWACHQLGNLFADQDKFPEAEQMYQPALQDKEKALQVFNCNLTASSLFIITDSALDLSSPLPHKSVFLGSTSVTST